MVCARQHGIPNPIQGQRYSPRELAHGFVTGRKYESRHFLFGFEPPRKVFEDGYSFRGPPHSETSS